jgi:UDPglucose 6-dehydrogenase
MPSATDPKNWTIADLPGGPGTGIRACVVGAGFVGLVTAAGLARLGHTVLCIDKNAARIASLRRGVVDFKERNLEALVRECAGRRRLSFDTELAPNVEGQSAIFVAVGTADVDYSRTDASAVFDVLHTLAEHLSTEQIVVIRSTVPVGTAKKARAHLARINDQLSGVAIVSSPEFLREGNAVYDFFYPDRIVLGGTQSACAFASELHADRLEPRVPTIITDNETAELVKYAANAFLATKLSFANELAALCESVGADVATVTHALGLDPRIGPGHLRPGPGFGGSCLPKDLDEYLALGRRENITLATAQGAQDTNAAQIDRIVEKVTNLIGELIGRRIAVLGLAYKAQTDDLRASPALALINKLTDAGADVHAFDPAIDVSAKLPLNRLTVHAAAADALACADAVVIMTEWPEFAQLDWPALRDRMASPNIVDARNLLDAGVMRELGFAYVGIGRPRGRDLGHGLPVARR